MKVSVRHDGVPVDVIVQSGELKPGSFKGTWTGYEVTSMELPGLVLETKLGIRGRARVTIEVRP